MYEIPPGGGGGSIASSRPKGYLFYLAPKAINLSDLNADWLFHHDFVMANRTCPFPHDLSARLLKSHMTL